ncbi:MAG: prolyl oligopeptidase family serine peptidase, partial [Planctomycetota bacterium]
EQTTRLRLEARVDERPAEPPAELFGLVEYPAPLGSNLAYLSAFEPAAELRPAIVWITGGFPVARGGSYIWRRGPLDNEQSASAFRDAGVVMLFPTVRGTAGNPGLQEQFYGEVDDVVAAGEYLRGLPGIDPERVYLGGHSSGGTLALLVAESTDLFRAVFSFGPVGSMEDYGGHDWHFDVEDAREAGLRSPIEHLQRLSTPTWVFEGRGGNIEDLEALRAADRFELFATLALPRDDHFSLLTPINRLLAERVASHVDGRFRLDLDQVAAAAEDMWNARREERDLRLLAELRLAGHRWGEPLTLRSTIRARSRGSIDAVREALAERNFRVSRAYEAHDDDGDPCLRATFERDLLFEPAAVLQATQSVAEGASDQGLVDEGWSVRLRTP